MEIKAQIFPLGCEFLLPYLEPYGCMTSNPREADFILAANNTRASFLMELQEIRTLKKPLAWWTIEDPNWFEAFLEQAKLADFVFTADEACITQYQQRLDHQRVFWLPLACSPEFHYTSDLFPDAAEFVISANWYGNEARLWSVDTVVEPLYRNGRSLVLFCYENFMWPDAYKPCWRGRAHYTSIAEQYRHGRVVLGVNNQRSGLDGRKHTVMTSMRTFEALACGKPFLAAHSDAYGRLGLRHGEHLAVISTQEQTLEWADRVLGAEGKIMAGAGRDYVLEHHTYGHRLASIVEVVRSYSTSPGNVSLSPVSGERGERQQGDDSMTYKRETEYMEQRISQLRLKSACRADVLDLVKAHDNPNMRSPELLALAEAMLTFTWRPGEYACEIGTFHGTTAAFLGRLADMAKLPCQVVSIDSFESPYLVDLKDPSSEYYKTVSGYGLLLRRNVVVGMHSTAAEPFMPSGIGLLLVDGGHDYDTCLSDLNAYARKVAPGGALAVDDVWYDSVRQATDEFCNQNPDFIKEVGLEKIEIYRKSANEPAV